MVHSPYWLTSQPVDGIDLTEYTKLHEEYMDAFGEEEKRFCTEGQSTLPVSPILKQAWKMGTFWYGYALESPTGLFRLFCHHIQPRYGNEDMDDSTVFSTINAYWTTNASRVLEQYDMRLREAFKIKGMT